jgi:hypothetical protein
MVKNHINYSWFIGMILMFPTSLPSSTGLSLALTIEKLGATGWVMNDVKVSLDLNSARQMTLQLTAASFRHETLADAIDEISLDCPLQLIQQTYRCSNGRLSFTNSPFGPQELKVSGEFIDSQQIRLNTQGFRVAGGIMSLNLVMNAGSWNVTLNGDAVKLDLLRRQFNTGILPNGSDVSGVATIAARVEGHQAVPERLDVTLRVDKFTYADVEGLHVAENGQISLFLNAKSKGFGWSGDAKLLMHNGQFYTDPYYIEVTNEPISMELRGDWKPETDLLSITQALVSIPQVMDSRSKLVVNLSTGEIVKADIDLTSENVNGLYDMFLQPMLIGSMVDDLAVNGALQLHLGVNNAKLLSLQLVLDEVDLDDRLGLFAVYGLNGRLVWGRETQTDRSNLSFQGGQLYRIDFGPMEVQAHIQQGEVKLEEPVDLPLLGGSLLIDRFHAQGLLADTPRWSTSAQFKDISLAALAEAFEWPRMEGILHGKIPRVHYQKKRMKMDGELVVDVFGGRVQVGGLLIDEPLGRVPELFANLWMEGLDLAQITQTFSFGHIQGGLDGKITGLHLASWEPIAFEAHFYTPDQDRLSHRISQRAVDNLTALGNGVGSGLSGTFLGIFEEFRYDRIELEAKLNGNVAELDGMPYRNGGYYIVKGSGLPRIDVIARNRQVAWKTLLERLKNIRVEGMEVK